MNDYLIRVMAREAGVRAFACLTTNLVAEACERHETPFTASIALGEALTGGVLFGTLLKVGQRVAVRLAGNQTHRKIVVEAGNNGKVRGYASLPERDILTVFPDIVDPLFIELDGQLTVVKDLQLRNLYESVVPLTGEGIVADLNNYLNQSEQIPSAVEMSVILSEKEEDAGRIITAGGLLVQALPPYEADTVRRLADRIQEMPPVEVMLNSGQTPEDILAYLFEDISYEVLEHMPLSYTCSCSRDRSRKALLSLGQEELIQLLETEGQAIVDCHFCHERYHFDSEELSEIISLLND
ncbi:MAG: Hsp33 family molecular chaperone HslO [Candidatus Promineifilaceae bacterium]